MEAVALRVVPRLPVRFASFRYKQEEIAVELVGDRPMTLAVTCPCCGTRCSLRQEDPRFKLTVNFSSGLVLTVHPPITCRNPACGWNVVVSEGVAFRVEEDRPPEEPWREVKAGEMRCEECRRPFRYGRMKQRVCQRCTPNNRGKWSTRKKE